MQKNFDMGNSGKNKMFTAERIAQIFLAIMMVATALVIMLNKPGTDTNAAPQPIVEDSMKITHEGDSAKPATWPNKPKPPKKERKNKTEKKTKEPIRQRDHLHEPMSLTDDGDKCDSKYSKARI